MSVIDQEIGSIYCKNQMEWFRKYKTSIACGLFIIFKFFGWQRIPNKQIINLKKFRGASWLGNKQSQWQNLCLKIKLKIDNWCENMSSRNEAWFVLFIKNYRRSSTDKGFFLGDTIVKHLVGSVQLFKR